MRPSFSRNRQLCRAFWPSSRRPFSLKPPRTPPSTPHNHRVQPQRRWASQSTSTNSSSSQATTLPPTPQTHYDLFPKTLASGPPPTGPFHIDTRELRKEFLQLQAVAHPDRHPAALKTRAEATSARINEAYKALQNPLLRAQYLLSLRGIDVAEDETAKVEDPELLMEVLDTREEIENAREEEELEELRRVNDERIEESERILDTAFREDNMEIAKGEDVRMRYWVNIKESLDNWEKGKPVVLVH
jgi:molecular chaperone HscB